METDLTWPCFCSTAVRYTNTDAALPESALVTAAVRQNLQPAYPNPNLIGWKFGRCSESKDNAKWNSGSRLADLGTRKLILSWTSCQYPSSSRNKLSRFSLRPVSDSPAVFSLARRHISLAFLAKRAEREKRV